MTRGISITSPNPKMRGFCLSSLNFGASNMQPVSSPSMAGTQDGAITYTCPSTSLVSSMIN